MREKIEDLPSNDNFTGVLTCHDKQRLGLVPFSRVYKASRKSFLDLSPAVKERQLTTNNKLLLDKGIDVLYAHYSAHDPRSKSDKHQDSNAEQ